jgi:hypothetical protein
MFAAISAGVPRQRTSTWPLVSLGIAVLVVLMILFAH